LLFEGKNRADDNAQQRRAVQYSVAQHSLESIMLLLWFLSSHPKSERAKEPSP
jgi:hypothetical protein